MNDTLYARDSIHDGSLEWPGLQQKVPVAHLSVEKLVAEAQDAILVLNESQTICFANPAARQLFLVEKENLVGRPFGYPVVSGEVTELDVPLQKGQVRTAEMRVSNTEWRGESAMLVIFRDVTERKLAEMALREAQEELERRVEERTAQLAEANRRLQREIREREKLEKELRRSNEELQQFAFIASHDLKEPLRKVSSFGNLLMSSCRDGLDETGRDYIQRMINAVKRMQDLIDSLLLYSRVVTHGVAFKSINLKDVVEGVLGDLEFPIEQAKAHIEVGDLPCVEADPNQMRQLFQNILQNAIKFRGSSNPSVKVKSDDAVEGESGSDAASAFSEMYRITVQDNGIGFDEKHVERIFGLFQRLEGRNKYEGTGMGLAICKRIVERHGGSITARSTPGKGTTFILTLPKRQKATE